MSNGVCTKLSINIMDQQRLFDYAYKITYLAQNPDLWTLFKNGLVLDTYVKLNKPWFHDLNINTVIDIGANVGRTVVTFRKLIPNAKIYAFEPLPSCFETLKKKTSQIENLTLYNLALGSHCGSENINLSSHAPSSSLLEMDDYHKQAFPFTSGNTSLQIDVVTLDSLAIDISGSLLIKLDVQGYEDKVIEGGFQAFRQAKIVIIEVSYIQLYKEQVLFDSLYSTMKDMGLSFAGVLSTLQDPITGKMIESDVIFIRS